MAGAGSTRIGGSVDVAPVRFLGDSRPTFRGVERRQRPREPAGRRIEEELAEEHTVLAAWRERLGKLPRCPEAPDRARHCQQATATACQEGTLALAEQMLFFMSEHFSLEDVVMRRGRSLATPHPQFDLHAEDHGSIIQGLVDALVQPFPCRWRDAVHAVTEERFERHLHTHDEVLRRFLQRCNP